MSRGYPKPKQFRPKNISKYRGDYNNIWARSSWETIMFRHLDASPSCVAWNSEETVIPYDSPVDGRTHRYFVDVTATFKYPDGSRQTFLVEIKPFSQTQKPNPKARNKQRLMEEVKTYVVNQAKWEAATEYAEKRGWKFKVMTEYDLGLKDRK